MNHSNLLYGFIIKAWVDLTPVDFFGFKFLLLDRLLKALVQLILRSLTHLLTLIR